MEESTFRKFERICKEGWQKLAKSGAKTKLYYFSHFYCNCPACEIAKRAYNSSEDLSEEVNECWFCPITVWRESIKETMRYCDSPAELHNYWRNTESDSLRKMYANEISKLEWEFLPEYKEIDEIAMQDLLEKVESLL